MSPPQNFFLFSGKREREEKEGRENEYNLLSRENTSYGLYFKDCIPY